MNTFSLYATPPVITFDHHDLAAGMPAGEVEEGVGYVRFNIHLLKYFFHKVNNRSCILNKQSQNRITKESRDTDKIKSHSYLNN